MKVAIAWYGAEGQSSYRYFVGRGDDVTIVTPKVAAEFPIPKGAQSIIGEDAFEHLAGFDLVVRSASLRPYSLKTDGKIWSATNEFFARCPAPIIGVTGTKGKGTTCSLIASILHESGRRVHLLGNIGVPALDALEVVNENDIVVYELSSFQLWDLERSPHIAVILMIEPDHLDVHHDMNEYVAAKMNIRRYQSGDDVCLYHPTNPYSREIALSSSVTEPKRYAVTEDGECYIKSNTFFIQDDPICNIEKLKIPGQHNQENACAAISAAMVYTNDKEAVGRGLENFSGLPHRLRFVREVYGVRYYDDSIATTPGSTLAAIKAFENPKVIILGGSDKGASYESVVDLCRETDTKVLAIGQTGKNIAELCQNSDVEVRYIGQRARMLEIVKTAADWAQPGYMVILSPASASFDMFKSYSDRGDQFVEAVQSL